MNTEFKLFRKGICVILICTSLQVSGQLKTAPTGFRVEPKSFSPPIEAIISSFINRPAPAFQANTLNQQSKTISAYYGKSLVLFFWSSNNPLCDEYISYLKELNKEMSTLKAELLTFGDESRSIINEYCKEKEIDYEVIPNGAFLGEAIYGKELGTPRFFVIDKKGFVKYIIPEEQTTNPTTTIANLKVLLTELMVNN